MTRRHARLLVPLLLGATASLAAPLGDNTVKLTPSMLKLPQNIGPMRYASERRFSDRRMGRAFAYNASGISLNVQVYDFGARDLRDGPDSVVVCEQYESSKREIEVGGNYQNVELKTENGRRMTEAAGSPLVREAIYEFDRGDIHAVSALWITAADGYLIKLRLSLRADIAFELADAREQILEAMATAIAARPARPAPSTASAPASIEVNSGTDPAEAAWWLAYAMELSRYAREHPESRPACGGRMEPRFAAEFAARRAALNAYRTRAANLPSSDYFEELVRVDKSGFLAEYVWHYLRDEKLDVIPPAGLDLAAFENFRTHTLVNHVVASGAQVRIGEVRALALASTQ